MKKLLLLCCSIILASTGCYKDVDDSPPSEVIIEIEDVFVNTSISGNVIDMEGNLLSEYSLVVNSQLNLISSDHFFIPLKDVKKKGQTIHVFKDEKQIGIQTQLLVENDINQMEIQQHPSFDNDIINGVKTAIDLTKSISLNFSDTKWANQYSGDVKVAYVHIQESNSLTPVGYTEYVDLLAVDSKGGFYVKATDMDNQPLKAQVENPIILNVSNLDEEINSLFVFDEDEEIWLLVADISNGDHIEILGEGYYTFANYTPGVFVEGKVIKDEKAVAYQPIQWHLASMSNTITGTEKGKWIGLLPEKENVSLNLLNPCLESIQIETLEVNALDIQGQNLVVLDSDNYQLLDMTILDCHGDIITSPNININQEGKSTYYVFSEEYTDRWIAVCNEFGIAVVNDETGENGPELEWSTEVIGSLDILTDCDGFDNGFSYLKIRDDVEFYPAFELVLEGDKSILQSADGNIKFIFKGMEKRMYDGNEVNVLINDINFGEKGYYIKCENSSFGCGIDNFNVTHYQAEGMEGGMVRVSFSGKMWMQTLSPAVAGEFEVSGVLVIKR